MSLNPKSWSRRNQIIAGVVTVTLIAVAITPSPDDDAPTVIESTVIDTTPPTTDLPAVPVTEAPTTTAAPTTTRPPLVTTPPVTTPPAYEWCGIAGPGISEDASISTLDTIGFGGEGSEYCNGFAFVYSQRNDRIVTDVCDAGFWDTSDEGILNILMSSEGGGNTHDFSVGMIDGLWVAC